VVSNEKEEFVHCLEYDEEQHGAWKAIPMYPACIEHVYICHDVSNKHQMRIRWDPEMPEGTVVATEPIATEIVAVENAFVSTEPVATETVAVKNAIVSTQSSPSKMMQWLTKFMSNGSSEDDTAQQLQVRSDNDTVQQPQVRKRQPSSDNDEDEASSHKVR
jgi:hypothetical protein